MPTNGFNSSKLDLEYTLNKHKINYTCLVDNWDNLSSKTTFVQAIIVEFGASNQETC